MIKIKVKKRVVLNYKSCEPLVVHQSLTLMLLEVLRSLVGNGYLPVVRLSQVAIGSPYLVGQ